MPPIGSALYWYRKIKNWKKNVLYEFVILIRKFLVTLLMKLFYNIFLRRGTSYRTLKSLLWNRVYSGYLLPKAKKLGCSNVQGEMGIKGTQKTNTHHHWYQKTLNHGQRFVPLFTILSFIDRENRNCPVTSDIKRNHQNRDCSANFTTKTTVKLFQTIKFYTV